VTLERVEHFKWSESGTQIFRLGAVLLRSASAGLKVSAGCGGDNMCVEGDLVEPIVFYGCEAWVLTAGRQRIIVGH
jgi:hypothetical protein